MIIRTVTFTFLLIGFGCTQEATNEPTPSTTSDHPLVPQVYTVSFPLSYFAERIAGDTVDVVFPAPADVDPADWSPPAEVVAEYQKADLILLNGAGYAGWIQNATLSPSRLVNTSAALADRLIGTEDAVTHTHGPAGDHSHTTTAITTWLDFDIASQQASAVFDALVRLLPEHEADFRERLTYLQADLGELDLELKEISGRIGQQPLLFSHPVYQYFIRRYGLNGRSVHWEPDAVPDDASWRDLQTLLAAHPATTMIWEATPLPETRELLERLGVRSVVFRPCGNRPQSSDFMSVMHENLTNLANAYP